MPGQPSAKEQLDRPSAPPRASVSTSPHRAKLHRPANAEHYVRRSRLIELFEELVRNQLTLVVAPAGTGKTSLVAGWTAETTTPTAWLSLDDTDRDGVQFWSAVIAALEPLAPDAATRASRCCDGRAAWTTRWIS